MEITATQKFVHMSPRKLRLVAPLVKNMQPTKALEILPHIGKRAAEPLAKVIKTAIANAKVKKLSEADLVFKEIQINEGPRLKRWRPGAKGRVKPYIKRMSHIRVVLETKEPEAIKKARKKIEAKTSDKGISTKSKEKSSKKKIARNSLKSLRKKRKEGK